MLNVVTRLLDRRRRGKVFAPPRVITVRHSPAFPIIFFDAGESLEPHRHSCVQVLVARAPSGCKVHCSPSAAIALRHSAAATGHRGPHRWYTKDRLPHGNSFLALPGATVPPLVGDERG